jgi:hypothetical protein
LGQIPEVLHPVELRITDSSPHPRGKVILDNTRALTFIPTDWSIEEVTLSGKPASVLDFGSVRLVVQERLTAGQTSTVKLDDSKSDLPRAYVVADPEQSPSHQNPQKESRVRSQTSTKTDAGSTVDGESVSTLVGRLKEFAPTKKQSKPRKTAGQKGTCKCCGAQVDPGTHQCGVCQQAGCSPWKRQCRFFEA